MYKKLIIFCLLGLSCLIAWIIPPGNPDRGSDGRASQSNTGAFTLAGGTDGLAILEALKDLGFRSIPGADFNDPRLNSQPHDEADGMVAYEVSDDNDNARLLLGADHNGVIWYHSEFRDGTHEELRRWQLHVANTIDLVKSESMHLPQ